MSYRIVLNTYGSLGDLHPFMAMALELKKRGHKAVIATSEQYRSRVEKEGIEFYPVRPDFFGGKKEIERAMNSFEGAKYIHFEIVIPHLRNAYNDLIKAVNGADIFISHALSLATPIVAEKTGTCWISTILSPVLIVSAYDSWFLSVPNNPVDQVVLNPLINNTLNYIGKSISYFWNEPVRQLRKDLGLPAGEDPYFEGKYSPGLVLALFSQVFAKPQPDWHKQICITGFTFYSYMQETLPTKLVKFLDEGFPPIVFTLGSAATYVAGDFYIESAIAIKQLGYRAVLITGENQQDIPQTLISDNVVTFSYIDYSLIFPRAAAIVHQGGIGTTAQALRAGKPMLVVPHAHDQSNNAAHLERLGVARVIERAHYSAQRVAFELRELLINPKYTRQATKVSREIRAEKGVEATCDLIEACVLNHKSKGL